MSAPLAPTEPCLRVSYIWRDEVMSDTVLSEPESVTLGATSDSTITTPELGLPETFAMFRPGAKGYVLTLGTKMGGTLKLAGHEQDVSSFVAGEGGGFKGTSIGPGDFGLIHLDGAGEHKLFFQFVKHSGPLPRAPLLRDPELLGPAFAFAFILIGFFLVYAVWIYDYAGSGFLWPGKKELVADYLLTRPAPIIEPEQAEPQPGVEDGASKVKPASTAGKEGKSGGEGKKERKRAENPDKGNPEEALPEKIQTGLLSKQSRDTFDKVRNRGGFDKKLGNALARLTGPSNNGGPGGFGEGKGTGIGPGSGSGTLTKGTGKGPGGGGSAHADVRTRGKLDTGGKRAAKGTPGGTGVKEVAVNVKTGKPDGSFGGLSPDQILKVVKTRQRAIKACYERELQRNKGLSGKIVISWKIDSSGKVKRPKVRSTTMRNGKVEDCIVRQVNSMKFPSPKGGSTASVNFPFFFGGK